MAGEITETKKEGAPAHDYGGTGRSPLTYNSYLKVANLKELQICQSNPAHHDEPLFIIIHQTYELWFKLILHELDEVFNLMRERKVRRATFFIRRIVAIMKVLVNQIHILETMSPKDFLGFRSKLNPASGFQSSQFREIEFILGLRHPRLLEHFRQEPSAYEALQARYKQTTLEDAFYELLETFDFKLPRDKPPVPEAKAADASVHPPDETPEQLERIQELKRLYDESEKYGDLHDLAESLIDFDELISLWRTHHVTVVERIIGFKRGTGGSEGVAYLRTTLTKRAFPDLWKLRTHLEL
jgi:tryptophan 2,3-dioxygenase